MFTGGHGDARRPRRRRPSLHRARRPPPARRPRRAAPHVRRRRRPPDGAGHRGRRRARHLVGHSFGGLVSRAAVLAAPAAFTSLTLLGSGPSRLVGARVELLEHLTPLLDAGGVPLVHETLEQLAMTDPTAQQVPEPTRAFLSKRFLANSAAGLRGMADAMTREPDRVAELVATGVPVLVAHGVADDAWTPAAQEDMAHRLGARHEVIPDAGPP